MAATTLPPKPIDPRRIDLSRLTREQKIEAVQLLEERERRLAQRLFYELFPDEDRVWKGPSLMGGLIEPGQIIHARDKYAKHLEFFEATAGWREICFLAANRIGKSFSGGGYALACMLTGEYPEWWPGRRFSGPISAWAAGDTYLTTRDIIQLNLLGEVAYRGGRKIMDGRGVVPGHTLGDPTWHSGVPNLVDTIPIRHVSGGWSWLGLKSYDQGRKTFQGTGRHVIWFDEEPPMDVYGEALIRTATVNGIVIVTFTPLLGLSQVVLSFLPAELRPDLGEDEEL